MLIFCTSYNLYKIWEPFCTSYNLYNSAVQVITCTRFCTSYNLYKFLTYTQHIYNFPNNDQFKTFTKCNACILTKYWHPQKFRFSVVTVRPNNDKKLVTISPLCINSYNLLLQQIKQQILFQNTSSTWIFHKFITTVKTSGLRWLSCIVKVALSSNHLPSLNRINTTHLFDFNFLRLKERKESN